MGRNKTESSKCDEDDLFPGLDIKKNENNTLQVIGGENIKRLSLDLHDSQADTEKLKKEKDKEDARKKRKRERDEYMAMLEREEQNIAFENNKNNMEYLAFLKNKTEKKGQALLYDMDTSDRNSSRM